MPRRVAQQQEIAPTAMVDMKILVHQAENLLAKDTFLGIIPITSDPYVEVRLMPEGKCNISHSSVMYLGKTKVIQKSINPVWGDQEEFSVSVPEKELTEKAIFCLTLFDFDVNSKDDFLGVVSVPITAKADSVQSKKWYDLEAAHGETARGRLQCTVNRRATTKNVAVWKGPNHCSYKFQLNVMQAKGLAMKDSFLGIKTGSDPYIIAQLVTGSGKKVVVGTTEYMTRTVNPKWNEELSACVPIDELDPKKAQLELTIMDRDDKTADDLMGVVVVPIQSIVKQVKPKKPIAQLPSQWYNVPADSANGEEATGRVQCSVSVSLLMGTE